MRLLYLLLLVGCASRPLVAGPGAKPPPGPEPIIAGIGHYFLVASAILLIGAAAMRVFNFAATWADEVLVLGLACIVFGTSYIWLASNTWAIYAAAAAILVAVGYRWRRHIVAWLRNIPGAPI
jgi:hypothetical protein